MKVGPDIATIGALLGDPARANMLTAIERALPCNVHEVMRPGTAQADDAGFGQRSHQSMAEQCDLVCEPHIGHFRQLLRSPRV